MKKSLKILVFTLILPIFLISCTGPDGKFKLPGGDARKTPADPKKRIEQNLKEGRGFRLSGEDGFLSNKARGGVFEFASSNELWRASLDTIDFMPLASVNYSGGIIITDWYSDESSTNESVKISIRFLTNEVRTDALDIKVFYKQCNQVTSCKVIQKDGPLVAELKKQIVQESSSANSQDVNPGVYSVGKRRPMTPPHMLEEDEKIELAALKLKEMVMDWSDDSSDEENYIPPPKAAPVPKPQRKSMMTGAEKALYDQFAERRNINIDCVSNMRTYFSNDSNDHVYADIQNSLENMAVGSSENYEAMQEIEGKIWKLADKNLKSEINLSSRS